MTTTAAPARGRRTTAKKLIKPVPQKPVIDLPEPTILRVPEYEKYEGYISRDITPGVSDLDMADYCFQTASNMLLIGPTGPGKSTFAEAYAAYRRKFFYSIPSGSYVEPSLLFGKLMPGSDGVWQYTYGPVPLLLMHGGVLYINEVNTMTASVATVLYPLLDGRREVTLLDGDGRVIRAHRPTVKNIYGKVTRKCWCDAPASAECAKRWVLIIADMNPGYEGTRPLSKALTNRFRTKLQWGYSSKVEALLTASPKLREMAESLRSNAKYTTPVSTNMLTEFEEHLVQFGPDYAKSCFVMTWPEQDRKGVEVIVDLHIGDIIAELNAATRDSSGPPDFASMTPEEIKAWRLACKPGDVDPEWGIYMEDWHWDEDAEADGDSSGGDDD